MKRHLKGYLAGFLSAAIILTSFNVYGAGIVQTITAALNSVNIIVDGNEIARQGANYTLDNGSQVPFSINYKGTTYLPMRKIAELVGKEVNWEGGTGTAILGKASEARPSNASNSYSTRTILGDLFIDYNTLNKIQSNIEDLYKYDDSDVIAYILNDDNIVVGNKIDIPDKDIKAWVTKIGKIYSSEFINSIREQESIGAAPEKDNVLNPEKEFIFEQEVLGNRLNEINFELIKLEWERVDESTIIVMCTIKNNNTDYELMCNFDLGIYNKANNDLIDQTVLWFGSFKKGETKTIEKEISIENNDIYLDVFYQSGY